MASSSSSLKKLVVCLLICSLICSSWPTASSFLNHDLAEKFAKWARKYGRVYKNETERLYRLGVFSRNFEFVNNFAKSGRRSYTVGLNAFADLTNEEFVATHTGFRRSGNPSATPFSYKNVSSTPSSIDWRALGAVTPVKNQGSCGSCWAFSAVAAVEGITMIMNQQLISLSEQQLLDCDYANNGCNGGWMNEAFSFIISIGGITTEANYPFVGYQGYCDTTKLSDYAASISGYQNVPTDDEIALMAAVANQPVSVAVDASGTAFQLYTGGVFTGPCGTTLNHAVTVVGYGTGSDGTKYWIVKNSWGTNWGLQGYILMQKDIADLEGLCGIASAASYPTV